MYNSRSSADAHSPSSTIRNQRSLIASISLRAHVDLAQPPAHRPCTHVKARLPAPRRPPETRVSAVAHQTSLYHVLTNVVYVGKVRYKDEVHDGEHQPIVDTELFSQVQQMLARNSRSGGRATRHQHAALLRGRLRCTACDCGMAHTYTCSGARQYRYYVCTRAQKQGWQQCPSPSISAGEIERFVVDQIQAIGRDPAIIAETLDHARRQTEDRLQQLRRERARHHEALRRGYADLTRLATSSSDDAQLADVHDGIRRAECRVT